MTETSRKRATALVADDHELPRLAVAAVLNRLGFEEVLQAASLHDAFDILDAHPEIELVLLDLDMPGVESAASLQAVRTLYPATRIAIVSGSTRREDMLMALTAGLHGYIPKLLRVDEMATAIARILEGGIYVPPSIAELPPVSPADEDPSNTFTSRQREVLRLLRQGRTNKEISRALGLGVGTVKVHVAALLRLLGASNRSEAAAIAERRGLD